jgi:hypothetical protein
MKVLVASIFALSLLGAGATNASVGAGAHIGPIGVGAHIGTHHRHCVSWCNHGGRRYCRHWNH